MVVMVVIEMVVVVVVVVVVRYIYLSIYHISRLQVYHSAGALMLEARKEAGQKQ